MERSLQNPEGKELEPWMSLAAKLVFKFQVIITKKVKLGLRVNQKSYLARGQWKEGNSRCFLMADIWGKNFKTACPSSQGYSFSSSHVWMWELDHNKSWALKNWCFWTMILEKTLESPLDYKEIQPVHPKENQPWLFIARTDAEAEVPVLWPPDSKSWLIGKDPDAGKDWGWKEKGTTKDKMVGWHHQLNGHEFE